MTDSHSVLIRRLAIVSIAGQLIWLLIAAVAGLIEPGYSEVRDAVSFLGARNAERPWLFDAGVAIWGAAFIATAIALMLDAPRSLRNWLGPTLVALTGLAQILDGFPFPADCRATIDVGCRAQALAGQVSWQHTAHGVTYRLGALALLLSVFAMAWRFVGDSRWGRADLLALGSGLFGIGIFCGLFFVTGGSINGGHYGVFQRLTLAAAGIWVAALAIGLLAIHGRSRDPAFRFVEWIRALPGGQLVVRPGSGLIALAVATLAILAGAVSSPPAHAGTIVSGTATSAQKPRIHKWLIPFGPKRKREMAAYSRRHYGRGAWRLRHPRVIVEHVAVTDSATAVVNTFASDVPDVELHELPNVCSHFVISSSGRIYQLVNLRTRCRHTVGLNWTAIGVEHTGFADSDILGNRRQLHASLRLSQYLRCRLGIGVRNVIGHNESLRSPYHHELVPSLRNQTHEDWRRSSMRIYRQRLRRLGRCPGIWH